MPPLVHIGVGGKMGPWSEMINNYGQIFISNRISQIHRKATGWPVRLGSRRNSNFPLSRENTQRLCISHVCTQFAKYKKELLEVVQFRFDVMF